MYEHFRIQPPQRVAAGGQAAQYGSLLQLSYTQTGGSTNERYNNFRNILSKNPCPQGG
jgi:hypothetical protein